MRGDDSPRVLFPAADADTSNAKMLVLDEDKKRMSSVEFIGVLFHQSPSGAFSEEYLRIPQASLTKLVFIPRGFSCPFRDMVPPICMQKELHHERNHHVAKDHLRHA